jgi:hypothetical protein
MNPKWTLWKSAQNKETRPNTIVKFSFVWLHFWKTNDYANDDIEINVENIGPPG